MRTYIPKAREAEALQQGKKWYVVDAEGQVLGRLASRVARRLKAEFGTVFEGREDAELGVDIAVDRSRQRAAIACHATQSGDNPVLLRRLDLLGAREHLRWLIRPSAAVSPRSDEGRRADATSVEGTSAPSTG